jgi:4-amino-4-deoxy-L-arabinose transferase-like glycosyltransferase
MKISVKKQYAFFIVTALVIYILAVIAILKPYSNPYIGDMMDKHMVYLVSQSLIDGNPQPSPYWNIGYPALLALFHRCGVPYITAERWLSLPFSLVFLFLTFIIAKRLSDVKVAFATCLALSFSEVFILKSIGAKDFMLSAVLILLSMMVFFDFKGENRGWRLILFGFILGLSFTFRYISLYLLPFFIFYIFIIKGKREGLTLSLFYILGFIIGGLPQFAIATYKWGNPFYSENAKTIWFTVNHIDNWARFLTTNQHFSTLSVFINNPKGFIANWFRSANTFITSMPVNPPLIFLSYAGLLVLLIKAGKGWLRFATVMMVIYLAITFLYRAYSDYLIPMMPFLCFGGIWFIYEYVPERLKGKRVRWLPLRYSVLALVLVYMLVFSYNRVNKTEESVVWERDAIGKVAGVLRADGVDDPSSVLSTDMWYLYLPNAKGDFWEFDPVPFDMTEPDKVIEYAIGSNYRYLLLYDRYKGAYGDWAGLPEKLMEMKLPENFKLMLDMEDSRRKLELYRIIR